MRVVRCSRARSPARWPPPATCVPREEAAVLPEVTGYRVARVLVDVGDHGEEGPDPGAARPGPVQGQLAQQRGPGRPGRGPGAAGRGPGRARVKDLDNQGVISQEPIDQRRFQAKAARATANAQAAVLKDMRTRATKLVGHRPGRRPDPGAHRAPRRHVGGRRRHALVPHRPRRRDRTRRPALRGRPGQGPPRPARPGHPARRHDGRRDVVRLVSPQVDPQTKLGVVRVRLPVQSATSAPAASAARCSRDVGRHGPGRAGDGGPLRRRRRRGDGGRRRQPRAPGARCRPASAAAAVCSWSRARPPARASS